MAESGLELMPPDSQFSILSNKSHLPLKPQILPKFHVIFRKILIVASQKSDVALKETLEMTGNLVRALYVTVSI